MKRKPVARSCDTCRYFGCNEFNPELPCYECMFVLESSSSNWEPRIQLVTENYKEIKNYDESKNCLNCKYQGSDHSREDCICHDCECEVIGDSLISTKWQAKI